MNPTLEDFHHKRDSESLNVMPRTNEYDTFTNGYPVSDQTMRNFSNSKNLQTGSYPDRHYSHLQAHPPTMTGLQPYIPTGPSVYHQQALDPYNSYNSMLNSLVNAYTRPNTGISSAYPGLGQTAPRLNLYPDFSTADPERNFYNQKYPPMYPSSPLPVPTKPYDMDSHLIHRYQRNDEIPGYMNNYPRTHSVPNKAYPGNVTDISRSQPAPSNGVKHGNNSIIDLTSPMSPDNFRSPSQRSDIQQERNHSRSSNQDTRYMPKENGNHQLAGPSGCENRIGKSFSSDSPYRHSNLLPYSAPHGLLPYNPEPVNPSENLLEDMRAFPKPTEPPKPVMHSPWGIHNKHHNPSPRQTSGLELGKKSLSPSSHIPSKEPSRGRSEITFNYPEASASRYDGKNTSSRGTPTKRNSHVDPYGQRIEHEKYSSPTLPPRNVPWNNSNESALTPYEHYVLEAAREGKLPSDVLRNRKFDDPRMIRIPHNVSKNRNPNIPSPKDDGNRSYENDKKEFDDVRSSVIQPMMVSTEDVSGAVIESNVSPVKEDVEKTHQELDPVKSDLLVDTYRNDSMHVTPIAVHKFDPPAIVGDDMDTIRIPPGDVVVQANCANATKFNRKISATNADGTPRVKRPYVKRSEIWNNKGKRKKKHSMEKISPKVCESTNDTVESKPAVTEGFDKPEIEGSTITVKQPVASEKLARPQRKSTGLDMDEYLYGYVFSDEETENDDSSDEDFHCPSNVNKIRVSKQTSKPLRRTRRSTRSQNDPFSENEESVVTEVTQRKRRKRRRKLSEPVDNSKTNGQDADTVNIVESTPAQEPMLKHQVSDAVQPPTDKVCQESQLQARIITQEMAEEMVKQINTVSEVKESLCESVTKTVENTDNVPAVVQQTNSIPLDELKISVSCPGGAARKKRKYTRKLDENGNPVKRARKIKSSERIPSKPRRKYEKKALKWFQKKNVDQQRIQENSSTAGSECNQNGARPTAVNTNLASDANDQLPTPLSNTADPVKIDGQQDVPDKSSVAAAACEEDTSAQPSQPVTVSEKENIGVSNEKTADSKSTPHHLRSSATTDFPNNKISGQGEVKIRKKPGRKPGWRKFPARDKDTEGGGVATLKLRRKYRNTGDGLKRFGRRKKGRRGRLRNNAPVNHGDKNRLLQATPITSTPTSSKFDISNDSLIKVKRKYNNSGRLEKKRKRMMHLGDNFQEKEVKRRKSEDAMATRNHTIHGISLELQNQELLIDSKDVSWHQKVRGDDESDTADETNAAEPSERAGCEDHNLSKCETPVSTIGHSHFPSSMKKLTCNSAIGETMLHKAARLGYVDNVQYYLESGANVNQCDNAGYTALHKACVHNNLEAASLLLEFGADVNKHAADGTRPFHDAVEYDHLEMARLMLACGADPLLSKYSGRAVLNMIRSEKMGKFMNAYLQELKESSSETAPSEWKFDGSSIFEKQGRTFYKSLDFAPEAEPLSADFELYKELPIPTYLLQPDDEHERATYYLLEDYLNCTSCKRNRQDKKVRIISMPTKEFLEQVGANQVQCIAYEKARNKPDTSGSVIEIVAADKDLLSSIGVRTVTIPLFGNVASSERTTIPHNDDSDNGQSVDVKPPNKSAVAQDVSSAP